MEERIISNNELAKLWERRDESYQGFKSPEDTAKAVFCWVSGRDTQQISPPMFTVGFEPLNEYGRGWYPHRIIRKTFQGWIEETIQLSDHI